MKRLFMLLCAVVAFAACEQAPIKEMQGAAINERNLEVSFEGGDDTRIQLQNGKTVWNEGDHVSVFYCSNVNEEWQFMGETGDRTGQIVPVGNSVNPPATHNHVVVAYPYSADYFYNTETHNIEASLPAVQNYLEDSYGTNGNIMVSSGDYKQVSLKSVCGWLKLQLTGDGEVVKSFTLRGNNGEQVAGELHINTSDATCVLASASGDAGESEVGGTLVRPDTILTEVTLDCGEGVALGEESTAFYIALPPQTFKKGFTVDIECDNYKPMTLSTTNTLTIKRNHIQPMTAMKFTSVPNNEIWYTSSDGNVVTPYNIDVFGSNIISNEYNNGKGVITFDGDVTTIGDSAFRNCSSLTSVTIPDSVTSIGEYAFYSCDSLTSVNIPDSVTTIGYWAFCSCYSLTSVTIGDSVTTIGNFVFGDCNSLTSVTIGNSVTTIRSYAFEGCTSLTSVNIPDSVTEIGYIAFARCDSLQEFTGKFATEDGRSLIMDNTIIAYANASGTTYTIPDSVTTIRNGAFRDCTSLTSVNIPDSVTTIGHSAFERCESLTSVYCKATTPPALGNIYVFRNNGSGRKIYVPAGSVNAYKSATRWSEYADAIVGYDFENGVVVDIPNNEIWYTATDKVTPYNSDAFNVTIQSYEWNSTTGIGVITFDGEVTAIDNDAFYYCDNLTSVTIPKSVSKIGYTAFYRCYNLKSVYCTSITPPTAALDYYEEWYAFDSNASNRKIYVPYESVDAYRSADGWREYASAIVGYNF